MASVENVLLSIADRQGKAFIEVSYKLVGDQRDLATRQPYRETVSLLGDDEGPGEDGHSELIPGGAQIYNGVVTFTPSQPEFVRTRAKEFTASFLNEDRPGFANLDDKDEIRALVNLNPVPPKAARGASDLVRRS
jgi:hypothetical protein